MATALWNVHGVVLIDYLEKGKIINEEYYAALVEQLKNAINDKSLQLFVI